MPRQIDPDTPATMRWYSDAEPVTVHTLYALLLVMDARLAQVEAWVQHLVDREQNP